MSQIPNWLKNKTKLVKAANTQKKAGIDAITPDSQPTIEIETNPDNPGAVFIKARNIDITQQWGKDAIEGILDTFKDSPNGLNGISIIDEATGEDLVAKLRTAVGVDMSSINTTPNANAGSGFGGGGIGGNNRYEDEDEQTRANNY